MPIRYRRVSTSRAPWRMRWIVIAILVFIVFYTFVNLRFRKTSPGFLPYEDLRERRQAASAGFDRIVASVDRPADTRALPQGAPISIAAGGLPPEVVAALVAPPFLPEDISSVSAAGEADRSSAYVIQFRCTMSDDRQQIASADLYVKSSSIVIVPECEKLLPELVARTRSGIVRIVVPRDSFPPGAYSVVLAARRTSRTWSLQVH